jgi:glycosyltransferase involved in cell wall biosynthesis
LTAKKSLISIIIPTYNRPELLRKAIKSVLNQTYKNYEIIIVDDSSLKDNEKVINNYNKKNIKYIKNKSRKGGAYSRNIGIKEAKGELIAFLDDDDEWMPEKLEKQQKVFEKSNYGLVVCYSLDKRYGKVRISKPPQKIDYKYLLKSFNLSSTSSYMVKKEIFNKVGYFDTNLPSAQEYDLALRTVKYYSITTVPEVLMIQHASENQISENWNKKIHGILAIYNKYGNDYTLLGFKGFISNQIKIIGMILLFSLGYIFGSKIHNIIVPAKEYKEEV